MPDRSFLEWPFFEDRHCVLAQGLDDWAARHLADVDHTDTDAACRHIVSALGEGGWLLHSARARTWRASPLTMWPAWGWV